MPTPTAVDSLARWLVLALAGLGVLLVLPGDMFGSGAVLVVGALHATVANLIGLTIMAVASVAFLVRLVRLLAAGGGWRRRVPDRMSA